MTVNSTKFQSLPGRAGAFILDVKEVSNVTSKYFYNFYTPEETREDGFEITNSPPNPLGIPSYVSVKFQKPRSTTETSIPFLNAVRDIAKETTPEEERLTFEKIISENDLGGNFFTGLTVSTPNETNELRDLTKESSIIAINPSGFEDSLKMSTTEFLQSYSENLKSNGFYFSEAFKSDLPRFFESISNENLGREELSDTISYLNYEKNVTYFSPILNDVSVDVINNATSVFSNSVRSVFGLLNEIKSKSILKANSGEDHAKSNYFPAIESDKVYGSETILDQFLTSQTEPFDISSLLYNNIEHVGYLVSTKITLKEGKIVTINPKLILDPSCEEVFIKNTPYGSTVGVKIAPVYAIKIPVYKFDASVQEYIKTPGVVFVSGKGKSTISNSVDKTPPPPPQDLVFNLANNGLEINWSLPFNLQRDIAKFRVFKRKNKNEPFTLLKQIEFGGIKDENIPTFLIEKPVNAVGGLPILKTSFLDRTFNEDEGAIYAITCIDIHDLTSNYSEQVYVRVNPVFNVLETKLFGRLGAYIQYPNMTMEKDVFDSVIKSSGYSKAKIYFNPDFLRVFQDSSGNKENLLNIDPNGDNLFKLNLINIDLQEQQNLDIIIGETISISEFDSQDSAIVKTFLNEN
jgi:hypothetical protein